MPASRAFQEWREAERLFRKAFEAQALRIARHETPSPSERELVAALRLRASELLHLMLADMRERAAQHDWTSRVPGKVEPSGSGGEGSPRVQ
ncbi:hypothetical protein [Pseudorhodoferax soli]|uniref:hypothetical protein n=1 Tax=Pseudorhodoferax soli TaxID=545864 RepID=UPI000DF20A71|nr:hypothetical protein [Pseudorhodoferax soli]